MAATLVAFWVLFQTGAGWVSVAFYVWGALLGILLISQFWTLANGIYDPRQAKRLFGFVGGGVMLGGMAGSGLTALIVESGRHQRAAALERGALIAVHAGVVSMVLGRDSRPPPASARAARRSAASRWPRPSRCCAGRARFRSSRSSSASASLGAAILDQQVNMAAEIFKGAGQEDSIGGFLAQIRFYTSLAAFVIQVWITPRIHRYLGIGFALLMLPTNLTLTAAVDPPQQRAVGAGARARQRSVVPLHRRQDDARSAVPAAAERTAPGSEAVGRRHRRPHGQGDSARC